MTRSHATGLVLLFMTAAIWGAGFVAQREGAAVIPPLTFNATRFFIGCLSLLPVIALFSKPRSESGPRSAMLIGGIAGGALLFAGINLQQTALAVTTAGKAAFITGLYIIFVPLIGRMFGTRIGAKVFVAAGLSLAGLYLLSVNEGLKLAPGDGLVVICAVFWALQVLVTGHFAPRLDGPRFAFMQFATVAVLSTIGALLFETISLDALIINWQPLAFTGIVATGLAFTLQILAQARVAATQAALVLSLETVFGALAGWAILDEVFAPRAMLGAALMLTGILLAQLPGIRMRKPIRLWFSRKR
ncbi:MAG: DMT family transporter [Paracoccaceae bacterium]